MAISLENEGERHTPKTQILVGEADYADPTCTEAVGHISSFKPEIQARWGLLPPTTGMRIGETNQQLRALSEARQAKTITRRQYAERKRALHERLGAYWEQFNTERRFEIWQQ